MHKCIINCGSTGANKENKEIKRSRLDRQVKQNEQQTFQTNCCALVHLLLYSEEKIKRHS